MREMYSILFYCFQEKKFYTDLSNARIFFIQRQITLGQLDDSAGDGTCRTHLAAPRKWKARTDATKLSSDTHMCTVELTSTVHTNNKNTF